MFIPVNLTQIIGEPTIRSKKMPPLFFPILETSHVTSLGITKLREPFVK
jgi:hypothetical protein